MLRISATSRLCPLSCSRCKVISKWQCDCDDDNDDDDDGDDDGDDDQKMFRKFLETWHTFSSPKVIFLIFGVRRENFLMGLKIDFKFEILGILVQNPHL